jgi:hypothetical protein
MKEGASVVLCLTDQQSDLMLLASGAVAQLRSTRLPSDMAQVSNTIIGEIKRSLVAASSQLNGQALSSALLIAPAEIAGHVENAVATAIGCEVAVIDPRVMLPAGMDQAEQLSHTASNRLAAIAGVIGTPAPDKRTIIDFKNPKKRAPKEVNVTRYVLAAAAGLLLLLAGGAWWYNTNADLESELASLKKEIADNTEMGALAKKQIDEFNQVKGFLDASPNWIEELERISVLKPSTEKVILWSPTFSVDAKGGGKIQSKVYGVSPADISEFEKTLRQDDTFRVSSLGASNSGAWKEYPWETMTTITVGGRGWNLLANKAKAPAAKATQSPANKDATETSGNAGKDTKSAGQPNAVEPSKEETGKDDPATESKEPAPVESNPPKTPEKLETEKSTSEKVVELGR